MADEGRENGMYAAGDDPARYAHGGVECIDALRSALTADEFRGFLKGNVIKYAWRERFKGGASDALKSADYARRLADLLAGECGE